MDERWWVLGGCLASVVTAVAVWSLDPSLVPPDGRPAPQVSAYAGDVAETLTTQSLFGASLLILALTALVVYYGDPTE